MFDCKYSYLIPLAVLRLLFLAVFVLTIAAFILFIVELSLCRITAGVIQSPYLFVFFVVLRSIFFYLMIVIFPFFFMVSLLNKLAWITYTNTAGSRLFPWMFYHSKSQFPVIQKLFLPNSRDQKDCKRLNLLLGSPVEKEENNNINATLL